ncbi:metal-dependent hydrolase family protein [Hoeflea prorocentri]|uniref:Amidohydrolase family protein n=1 Tax=Hoeflea prorocentri TaxID=1922333 RepID=A0A9X3UMY1_9HYPH|nr:amidohydrolase family protein [Hoeflea prorocentri]MCY6382159.1 amidohydrolase family protein [Hoeflea prorocentri]MDA5399959.1 amidohydrolase family protein [Hoeflea prorocentri]
MSAIILSNARLFDGVSDKIRVPVDVLIEDGRIREVGETLSLENASRIDVGQRFVMPGLIDAHYHANTPSYDFYGSDRMPPALLGAHAARLLSGALDRGYTTLRDAGGGDLGLKLAIDEGLIDGPRFYYPGRALTQTGGHGDMRRRNYVEPCGCAYSGVVTQAVDGPDEVRKAAREEFRKGATHIKIFVSGGVSTDLAPLEMPHFSDEEISVAVEEAERRGSYVMAHCHTDKAAQRCIRLGVRTIEHGSLIGPETAAKIAAAGAYVVPTLSAGELIAENASALGLPESAAERVRAVNKSSLEAIEACAAAGVKLGLGCDLHGHEFVKTQGRELLLRGRVQPAIDVLRSATSINAEIVQAKGELGVIAPGAHADIIVVDGDPLEDLSIFVHSAQTVALVMKGGRIVRSRL